MTSNTYNLAGRQNSNKTTDNIKPILTGISRPVNSISRPINQPIRTARQRKKPLTPIQRAVRKIKRYSMYITFTAIIIAVLTILITLFVKIVDHVNASAFYDFDREREYVEYTIKTGDTLWTISENMASVMPEYGGTRAYLEDIKNVNHISGDKIVTGKTILLPYYKSKANQTTVFAMYNIPQA